MRIIIKKYIVLFLFTLITASAFSQTTNYRDVVYLKNGNIIRGIIIEQVPNKSIKIETADKSIFHYNFDEIDKLARESFQKENQISDIVKGTSKGYNGFFETGYEFGVGTFGADRLKLDFINGYQFNPYFFLGLGLGLRYYPNTESQLIPVFTNFRATFLNNKISPYTSINIGYSFDARNGLTETGVLLSSELGVSFKISKKSAIDIGFGYEMQKMYLYYGGIGSLNGYQYEANKNSGAITLDLGVSF